MSFSAYHQSIVLGFTQVSNYRSEIWFQLFSRVVIFFGLVLLWSVISQSTSLGRPFSQVLSYLFIANGTREIVDTQYLRFSREIIELIKSGQISTIFLRPANPRLLIYFQHLGSRGMELVLSISSVILGVSIIPHQNFISLVLYLVCILIGLFQSYSVNTIVGSIAFWTTEAKGIRNVANHFNRLFSGSLIPLDLFPPAYLSFIKVNPFAINAYIPAVVLQGTLTGTDVAKSLLIAFIWSIILYLISRSVWKSGLKQYESVGI